MTSVQYFDMFKKDEQIKKLNKTMDNKKQERTEEVFQAAIAALRKNFPGQVIERNIIQEPVTNQNGYRPDIFFEINLNGQQLKYYADIKTAFTPAGKAVLLHHKEHLNYPLLLIARYVNPDMADKLKENGQEFLDAAGNAFINRPPLFLYIKGNRLPEHLKAVPPRRTFRQAGLKVIYAFLCNPGLENQTYRKIANLTDVALGTIDWIMKELKNTGYLIDMGERGKKLTQKEALLNEWVTAYPVQLRPKQILGTYKGEPGWWENRQLDPVRAQWGGELAAAKMTKYLQPEKITIYTEPENLTNFLIQNRLRKDPAGNIEILKRFWMMPQDQFGDIVHPILVYADLMATGNERNIEVARMIYEQYIVQLVRED